MTPRTLLAAACLLTASQLSAQAADPVAEAEAMIEAHNVSTKTPCSIPMPAIWNAAPWEQEAAFRRREAFSRCLGRVMEREQERLQKLSYRLDEIRADNADADWSGVDMLLNSKWAELERVEAKLRTKENWADTAVSILDTFTSPGAPFDSSPLNPARNPYGASRPPSPYFRPVTSVSAPGTR